MSGEQDLRKVAWLKRELADAHDDIRALTVQVSDSEKSEQFTQNLLYAAQDEMLKLLKAAVAGMLKVGFAPNQVVSAVGQQLRGRKT